LSFDVTVCFASADELPSKWQAALRELGINDIVSRPDDWQKGATWFLLEKPTDKPEENGFEVYIGPILKNELSRYSNDPEEQAVIAKLNYVAAISTRMSAGTAALMYAGALAKATDGVMLDPQVAAFEPAFEQDLSAHRGARGSKEKPTLAERGFYDATLAWELAKAASTYEAREKNPPAAGAASPPMSEAKKSEGLGWLWVVLGVLAVGGVMKLTQRKKENK